MKKLLAMALALLMLAVMLPVTAMAEEGDPTCVEGVWQNVNPTNVQDVLDGKYGPIDNTTIVLTAGTYGPLELGRATNYADSKTTWYNGQWSEETGWTRVEPAVTNVDDLNRSNVCFYHRTISNVSFTAAPNAAVSIAGVKMTSGHMYGSKTDPILDHVRNKTIDGTPGSYYLAQTVSNITFEGITFTAKSDINTSNSGTTISGITFKNCTFNIKNTARDNQAIRYYNENNNGKLTDLTVDNCKFYSCFQGVYTGNIKNVTVKDSTFDTTGHNAIAIQDNGTCDHGAVVITGNTFKNIGDRIIRFGNVNEDTTITISGNASTNSGDEDGEIIKAEALPAGMEVTMSNNNWGKKGEKDPTFGEGFTEVTVIEEPTIIIVPSTPTSPEFLSGANQTVGVGAKATFRIDKDFVDFMSVAVDGITLDKTQYKAWSGSTYVELLSSYMKTLSEGTHTLSAYFNGATATTAFTISKTVPAQQNPATGANDFVGAAAALAVVSLLGMAVASRKK